MILIGTYLVLLLSSCVLIFILGISMFGKLKVKEKVLVIVGSCAQLALFWFEAYIVPTNEFSVLQVFTSAGVLYAIFLAVLYFILKTKKMPVKSIAILSVLVILLINILVYLFDKYHSI
jgi:hypothetical protein